MLYDIRLALKYDYETPVHGGRHHIRVTPVTTERSQRVISTTIAIDPLPARQTDYRDFFGNVATSIVMLEPHDHLEIRLAARVQVHEPSLSPDASPRLDALIDEISSCWSVTADSPQHFLAASPRVRIEPAITAYAQEATAQADTAYDKILALCLAIYHDFTYDPKATDVETQPAEAFKLRKGVCQDFAHVMIAGLRGMGIPAGYVSGFLRTEPPPGKPRLEGADAMHAWVRAWCGQAVGWVEFDPTNAMVAGTDHILIGHGRDYADISPIVGVLRTHGSHETTQSVDVIRVE